MLKIRSRSRHPPEQLLCELKAAELFVVSSLRLWMEARNGGATAGLDWRQGFQMAGISAAGTRAFDSLCQIIAASAPRRLDVRALFCGRLGRDEGRTLGLVALLQRDRMQAAQAVLGRWCPPAAARLALVPALDFATSLNACRLWLPVALGQCRAVPRSRCALPDPMRAPLRAEVEQPRH